MNNSEKTDIPWYQRSIRWGQTNLTEMDPIYCDMNFWRDYWHKTKVQGIIVNAGGIVAYYPSSFELHYKAEGLGERDLFGDFISAGKEEGLAILARMDINRATQEFYDTHPDWFVVNSEGVPYTIDNRYFSCINSGYYKEYIPQILKEIITSYQPDGFTDNSWTGAKRDIICYCENCKKKFKAEYGYDLPRSVDWKDPIYLRWIKWSYKCRIENWDLFNNITQEFGGPDCLWLGMVNANPVGRDSSFCDLKEVGERSKIIMCDHQSRDSLNGFEQNSLNGSLLHGIAGWDKVIPESMANYIRGTRTFRLGSNPPKESQLWVIEGIAGGISPWYHHIGATHEDRRQFENLPALMQWHKENENYLYNRLPVSNVGLVWSQDNTEFYGCGEAEEKVALPWHGFVKALTRSRIPFIPVHADHITREAENLDVLILSHIAVLSDNQVKAICEFVEAGGSLVFTGASATLNNWGELRKEFPLESITGIKNQNKVSGAVKNQTSNWAFFDTHNYLRLPKERHPIISGFDNTDILPFGGVLQRVEATEQMQVIATYIPQFPIYPPEFSWMRETHTDIPVILAGQHQSGGRIVYFAGDVDRCYGRTHLPDLGKLLTNAVKWAATDKFPLKVEGPGYLDCKLYSQEDKLILHLINLSGTNQNPGYVEEFLPVGPITVSINTEQFVPKNAHLKVSGIEVKPKINNSWATFQIDSLLDHELIILD